MKLTNLYSEIQVNPKSQATYRRLSEYYKNCNQQNIADAFCYLIEKKFNVFNSTDNNQKQRTDNTISD